MLCKKFRFRFTGEIRLTDSDDDVYRLVEVGFV